MKTIVFVNKTGDLLCDVDVCPVAASIDKVENGVSVEVSLVSRSR